MPIIHYDGPRGDALYDTRFSGVNIHERHWWGHIIEGRQSNDANGCGNEAGLPDCNGGGPLLGSSTTTSSGPTASVISDTTSSTHRTGASTGVIVAATLIGVAVLVFAIMGVILLRRWRRNHTAPSAEFIRNEKAVQRMRNPLRRSLARATRSDEFSRISSVEAALLPKPPTARTHHNRSEPSI